MNAKSWVRFNCKFASADPVGLAHLGYYRSDSFWLSDVSDDEFIHFTTPERAQQIIESNRLMADPPSGKFGIAGTQAVSTQYGKFVPTVQTTHVSKQLGKETDLVAVVFKTNDMPTDGSVEEVIWPGDVTFTSARVVGLDEAIAMLPGDVIGEMDRVFYEIPPWADEHLSNEPPTEER
jgi:hypothetical protein